MVVVFRFISFLFYYFNSKFFYSPPILALLHVTWQLRKLQDFHIVFPAAPIPRRSVIGVRSMSSGPSPGRIGAKEKTDKHTTAVRRSPFLQLQLHERQSKYTKGRNMTLTLCQMHQTALHACRLSAVFAPVFLYFSVLSISFSNSIPPSRLGILPDIFLAIGWLPLPAFDRPSELRLAGRAAPGGPLVPVFQGVSVVRAAKGCSTPAGT